LIIRKPFYNYVSTAENCSDKVVKQPGVNQVIDGSNLVIDGSNQVIDGSNQEIDGSNLVIDGSNQL
jgi:hypothetical protein